jgi:putative ABC transport system substrate-binding protein
MRRRDFLALVVGAVAWPIAGRAQEQRVPSIGVLVRAVPGSDNFWRDFREAMRQLGYIEGKNIRFEFRSDQGQMSRLPELAAELVRLKVDVIVPWYTPAAIASKQATGEIPIVCALCGDLVGTGLAESLARPGGNVTGITSLGADTAAKSVELIREIVPSVHRIAALANAPDPWSKIFLKQIQLAGETTGTAIDAIMIHSAEELDAAFPAMERSRPDAIIVQPSLPTKRAAELALNYRITSRVRRTARVRQPRRVDELFCTGSRDVPQGLCLGRQDPERQQTR